MGTGEKPGSVSPGISIGEVPIAIPRPGEILQGQLSGLFPDSSLPPPMAMGNLRAIHISAQKTKGKKEGKARCEVMVKQVLNLNLAAVRPVSSPVPPQSLCSTPAPVPIALGPSDQQPSLLFCLMAPGRAGARDQAGAQPRCLLQVGAVNQTQDKHCKGPKMKRCLDFSHTCKQTLRSI